MGYVVIARKYRPKTFEDVIGQEAIAATLVNAIRSDRVAQAYLFSGQRGVGKTTMARIFAKTLNCPNVKDQRSCDKCPACDTIMSGNNTDVVEIDGASNNSVEDVRDLRESVKYAPLVGPYKIYVIDEVHMLSNAAFNALLKTLEEPPRHVKFIFATTEPHRVIPTIRSRCQQFDFRSVSAARIRGLLETIAQTERATVEPRALDAISRRARGSVRDAESCLDQLLAFQPQKPSYQDYLTVFGLTAEEKLVEWVSRCAEGAVAEALKLMGSLSDEGADATQLAAQLAEILRDVLLAANGLPAAAQGLDQAAAKVGPDWALYALQVVQAALRDMRLGADGRLALEMATMRIASAGEMVSLDEIRQRLEILAGSPDNPARPAGRATSAPAAPVERKSAAPTVPSAQSKGHAPPAVRGASAPAAMDLSAASALWNDFVKATAAQNKLISGMLSRGRVVEVDEKTVTVGFDSSCAMQLDQCREKFDLLQHVCRRIFGLDLALAELNLSAPAGENVPAKPAGSGKSSQEVERVRKAFNGTIIREL